MKHLSLEGAWRLKLPGRERPVPASVPGCIHSDLMAAGLLKDPRYRDNIAAGRVAIAGGATYERDFSLNPIPPNERIFLHFLGLDTFASVYVNGAPVARTDNMFQTWRFDITALAKAGPNTLAVAFDPPEPVLAAAEGRRPLECPAQPGEPAGRSHIRKRRADFGSDYAPCLPTMGIWRGVFVEFANGARILSAQPRQRLEGDAATIDLDVKADFFGPVASPRFAARLMYRGATVAETFVPPAEDGSAHITLKVRNPLLWWPNGMGEQPLYELQVELLSGRRQIDYVSRRIGFRTYRLETGEANGRSVFRLFVNDRPVLVRGAIWNTPDLFVARPTRVEYARLVKAANVANFNLLRVTGDGIYEKDYFYDLCDEYGICVWQDFMFSDAAYPFDDAAFRDNVRREVEDVVPRLGTHACLALWCGGDNLLPHVADGDGAPEGKTPRAAYGAVVDGLLRDTVARLSPGTPFIRDAVGTDGLAVVADINRDRNAYTRACAPFYTSFGFPSLPDIRGLDTCLLPADRNLASPVFQARIVRAGGLRPVTDRMRSLFRPPADFEGFALLSQIQQGLACKALVEHWRRQGAAFGGAVFSRLNDCFAGLSDASLDPDGRWKGLHFFARRFYGNLMISGVPNAAAGTLDVYVHNDGTAPFDGKVRWRIIDLSGHVWREMEKPLAFPAGGPRHLGAIKLTDLLQKVGPDRLLVCLALTSADGHSLASDCLRFSLPKALALEDPGVTMDIRQLDDHCFAVTLSAARPALWCWLDFTPCPTRFDDNFVCVLPGQPQRVRVTPVDHFKLADFRRGLRYRTLFDMCRPG